MMAHDNITIVTDSIPIALALHRCFTYVSSCNVQIIFDSISKKDQKIAISKIPTCIILNEDFAPHDIGLVLKNCILILLAFKQQPSHWLKWLYNIRCKMTARNACVIFTQGAIDIDYPLIFKTFMTPQHKYFPFLDIDEWKREGLLNENCNIEPSKRLSHIKLRRCQRIIRHIYKPISTHGERIIL